METIWNKIEAVDLIKLHENAQQEKIDMVIYATSDAKDSLQIINGKRVYSNKAKIMAEFEKQHKKTLSGVIQQNIILNQINN